MAGPADRPLSAETSELEELRGDTFVARVHPEWRQALENAGWLRHDPLQGRAMDVAGPGGAGRGGLHRATLAPGTLLVRPLRRGGWLSSLLGDRFVGRGRPLAEAEVTTALRRRGAPVPELALALAWRPGALLWRGLVATRELPAVDNGFEFLANADRGARLGRGLAAAGRALRRFHDAGGRHRDLNLGNLLISRETESPQVSVIDLDGARICREVSARRRMLELMRLYRSLRKNGISGRERIAAQVFRHYCAGDRALRTRLLRWRRYEAWRVALHALRYDAE